MPFVSLWSATVGSTVMLIHKNISIGSPNIIKSNFVIQIKRNTWKPTVPFGLFMPFFSKRMFVYFETRFPIETFHFYWSLIKRNASEGFIILLGICSIRSSFTRVACYSTCYHCYCTSLEWITIYDLKDIFYREASLTGS